MDKLRTIYGDEFLKYTLAVDEITAATNSLTAGQKESLDLLEGIAKRLFGPRLKIRAGAQIGLLHSIAQYVPQSEATLCSALRTGSGGTLAAISRADPVIRKLLVVARDIWPVFLIPRPADWPLHLALSTSVSSHPVTQELHRLLRTDDLCRFFADVPNSGPGHPAAPDFAAPSSAAPSSDEPRSDPPSGVGPDGEASGMAADIASTAGQSVGVRLSALPESLLLAGRYRQLLGRDQSLAAYLGHVEHSAADARKLAAGGQVSVPMLVGLTNLRMQTTKDIATPFGVFRAPRDSDAALLTRMTGDLTRVTAVFETAFPLRMLATRPATTAPDDPARASSWKELVPAFEDHQRRAERSVHLARYALLLASDRTLLAPTPIAQSIFDPTRPAPIQSCNPQVRPPADIGIVDDAARLRVEKWGRKIEKQHPRNLDFGVRRLLAAASTERGPLDGLVDAVACWTNMFGAPAEADFRLCGAMASILEPYDRVKRLTVFRALQRLHGASRAIVHGGEDPDSPEVGTDHQIAVVFALDAMRKLYDFPALLAATSPEDRGRDVLLYSGAISYGS